MGDRVPKLRKKGKMHMQWSCFLDIFTPILAQPALLQGRLEALEHKPTSTPPLSDNQSLANLHLLAMLTKLQGKLDGVADPNKDVDCLSSILTWRSRTRPPLFDLLISTKNAIDTLSVMPSKPFSS